MSLFHLAQKVVRAEGRDSIFATVIGEEAASHSAPGRRTRSAGGKEAPLPIVLTSTAPCSYTRVSQSVSQHCRNVTSLNLSPLTVVLKATQPFLLDFPKLV